MIRLNCCSSANRSWLLIEESNRSAGGIADQELGNAGVCKMELKNENNQLLAIRN
jgi:hypothetical protein